MIELNQETWVMPIVFEDYVKHFREAQDAWTRLHAALDQLANLVGQVHQNPAILGGPSQTWPTQAELRQMLTDAQTKSGPLIGEFSQLPADVKTYAPNPNTVGQRPGSRGR